MSEKEEWNAQNHWTSGEPLPSEPSYRELHESFPGEYPFLRGIQPTMYRGRLWTMRQYSGFGSAEDTNQRFLSLLKNGQTGLSVAFDLPTQMGFDPDHSMARGEVGRVGVSISRFQDLEALFDKIPLEDVSISMTINSTAAILLSFVLVLAKKRGIPFSKLRGTVQNDILKEYIARGTYIYPPQPSLRLVCDLVEFCSKEVPHWNPISISGYHIREAGSNSVQEISFTFANAITYVHALLKRGLPFDEFGSRLSFFFNSHNQFFDEVAKFRAARSLWSKLTKERFGAKLDRSSMLRFHVQTAGSTLTAQQPSNNLTRVTLAALAAVLGGCQSLHTNSKDEALALPTEESAILALRTQQILAKETGIDSTIDPFGGSFLLEERCIEIENAARKILEEIDSLGGSVAGIEQGYFQRAIGNQAYRYQQEMEKRQRAIVGVNFDEDRAREVPSILTMNPRMEEMLRNAVTLFRAERDTDKTRESLDLLLEAARDPKTNLMPYIIAAIEADATLGEISDALRKVFGLYQPSHLGF